MYHMTRFKVSPCKGCEERHPACHDSCGKYAEWLKEYKWNKMKNRLNRNKIRKDLQVIYDTSYYIKIDAKKFEKMRGIKK